MTHTSEPWPEPELIEYDKEISWWRIPNVGDFSDKADAERARACVNALEGVSIEAILAIPKGELAKLMATKWTIGDRIYDDSYKMGGVIYDVNDGYSRDLCAVG